MKTPRELLSIRDDLAQKVAEHQLDRQEAKADLRAAADKYPGLADDLKDGWADVELDKGIRQYKSKRDKAAAADIVRRLAEIGMEAPTLDGEVALISHDDKSYLRTLADFGNDVEEDIASAWRWVRSRERQQDRHEILVAAAGANMNLTREQALTILKFMPEDERRALIRRVKAQLSAGRRQFAQERYGFGAQAAEG